MILYESDEILFDLTHILKAMSGLAFFMVILLLLSFFRADDIYSFLVWMALTTIPFCAIAFFTALKRCRCSLLRIVIEDEIVNLTYAEYKKLKQIVMPITEFTVMLIDSGRGSFNVEFYREKKIMLKLYAEGHLTTDAMFDLVLTLKGHGIQFARPYAMKKLIPD